MNLYDTDDANRYTQDLQDRHRSPAPQAVVTTDTAIHTMPVALHVLPKNEMGYEEDQRAASPYEINIFVFCQDHEFQEATGLARNYMDNPYPHERKTTPAELALHIDRIAGGPTDGHMILAHAGHAFRELNGTQPTHHLILQTMQEIQAITTQRNDPDHGESSPS